MITKAYLNDFSRRINLAPETLDALIQTYDAVTAQPAWVEAIDRQGQRLNEGADVVEAVMELAKANGFAYRIFFLLFFINAAPRLQERYREKGLPEPLYWATIGDLRAKSLECIESRGEQGLDTLEWFYGFFRMTRFKLGRLQFELLQYSGPSPVTVDGVTIQTGDKVVNIHIPSHEAFTQELRLDAYRQARAFFRDEFSHGPVILRCRSWLLYPDHEEMLGEKSNIVGFIHDFTLVDRFDTTDYATQPLWRIFNTYDYVLESFPRDTGIQRAYIQRMQEQKSLGWGEGIRIERD